MLAELQKTFIAGLLDKDSHILDIIQPNPKLSALNQFAIYKNSTYAKLQRALTDIYPVCRKLVGDDFFNGMCDRFIQQTPSQSYDLNKYGETLSSFISTFQPAQTVPYLSDIASLEWAWHLTFSAPDTNHFDFEKFAACYATEGENILFSLPRQSTLLVSPYPLHQIWKMNNGSDDSLIVLEAEQSYHFLIWRKQFDMRIDAISEIDWQLLTWIQSKMSLGQLCKNTAMLYPEITISQKLPEFISHGWITDFATG